MQPHINYVPTTESIGQKWDWYLFLNSKKIAICMGMSNLEQFCQQKYQQVWRKVKFEIMASPFKLFTSF